MSMSGVTALGVSTGGSGRRTVYFSFAKCGHDSGLGFMLRHLQLMSLHMQ